MSEANAQSYLERVLALDPRTQFAEIARLRDEFHATSSSAGSKPRAKPGAAAAPREAPSRQDLVTELNALREGLLELEPEAVEARLKRLDLAEHPDLERARARLVGANQAREQLASLLEDEKADHALARQMRQLLTADPQTAVDLRNRTARTMGRGARGNHARAFAKLVRKRYPQLAALEPQWLERLESAKKDFKDSRAVKGGLGCFGVYLLVQVLRLLAEWAVEYFGS